jgi:hypothetical protein
MDSSPPRDKTRPIETGEVDRNSTTPLSSNRKAKRRKKTTNSAETTPATTSGSSSSNTASNNNPEDPKTKRKVKVFPPVLAKVTDDDRKNFGLALELDPNPKSKYFGSECLVAQTVTVKDDDTGEEILYDLKPLVLDHLRQLCRNVGVCNAGSMNKFELRKALAAFINYQNELDRKGISATSTASRLTSTICRAVNVVFSENFVKDFMSINDRHSRQSHETHKTYKGFWINAALAHNSCFANSTEIEMDTNNTESNNNGSDSDDSNESGGKDSFRDMEDSDDDDSGDGGTKGDCFSSILNMDNDPHIAIGLVDDKQINLMQVSQFDTKAFRKKINDLFKIRRRMKENMTVSGTHDNEAWNFVESAMASSGCKGGFTKIGVYYFYKRCEGCDGIDAVFSPFLDPDLLGDSTNLGDDSNSSESEEKGDGGSLTSAASSSIVSGSSSRKRKMSRAAAAEAEEFNKRYMSLVEQGQSHLNQMEEANIREKTKLELKQQQAARDIARFQLEQETANLERMRLELDVKKNNFFARLEVAKAMNDTEELAKLKEEASKL